MKIWLLTSEFPPDGVAGGISAYCVQCVRALGEAGHDVTVFTQAPEAHPETSEEAIGPARLVRVPIRAGDGLDAALGDGHLVSYCLAQHLVERLREGADAPDMIEVQDYAALGYFLQKRKLMGEPMLAALPIVVMAHTPAYEILKTNDHLAWQFPAYWIGRCERFSLLAADQVLSPSWFLAERIEQETGRTAHICRYPAHLPEARCTSDAPHDRTDLLYVGRLEPRKGILQLLAAMRRLWDGGHRIALTMVGGDANWVPAGTKMSEHIHDLYAPYIDDGLLRLLPTAGHDAVLAMMRRATAIVFPSVFENFPFVCIEAMAMGLPVIASRSGGQSEMMGDAGDCGTTFDWSEGGSFECAVLDLLALREADRERLGQAARLSIAALCGPEVFVRRRAELLETLQGEERGGDKDYPFLNQLLPGRALPKYRAAKPGKDDEGRLAAVVTALGDAGGVDATLSSLVTSTCEIGEIVVLHDARNEAATSRAVAGAQGGRARVRAHDISEASRAAFELGLLDVGEIGGEHVAVLDAGDRVDPALLGDCVALLRRYRNVSFAYSWSRRGTTDGDVCVNFDTELPYLLAAQGTVPGFVARRFDLMTDAPDGRSVLRDLRHPVQLVQMVGSGRLGISIPEVRMTSKLQAEAAAAAARRRMEIFLGQRTASHNAALYDAWGEELYQLLNVNGPGWLWANPSLDHPPVGHVQGGSLPPRFNALRSKFDPTSLQEVARLMDEPAVAGLVRAVLATRLHRPVLATLRAVRGLGGRFRRGR